MSGDGNSNNNPSCLPYCKLLFRSKEGVELFSIPSERDEEADIKSKETRDFLFKGSTTFQSILPDGSAAFVHRPEVGIFKLMLNGSSGGGNNNATKTTSPFLSNTGRVQIMDVSPRGTYLLTWERPQEGEKPNLKIWNSSTGEFVIGFRQKALKRESWPYVQWTNDEQFAFLLGTNEIRVYPGKFPQLAETRFVDKMRIPGISSMSLPPKATIATTGTTASKILFTSFVPQDKNNKPARASLYEYPAKAGPVSGNASYPSVVSKSLFQAEEMTVHWSPRGDAALIALQTTVDTSGQSYYGSTTLYLMSPNKPDDPVAVPLPQEGPVLDVSWMPDPTKPPSFAVAAGKMPSMTSLHNGNDGKATFLFGNAHRNTIAWAPHGRFVSLAGFGNLAGGMTFWDRNKLKQIPPASQVTASCTVGYGWSPDSRLFCVSTTSPRMNVDNCVNIYRYNGEKMKNLPWNNDNYKPDKLLEACFLPAAASVYPDRPQSPNLKEMEKSSSSSSGGGGTNTTEASAAAPKPAGRYVPPSARNRAGRGGGTSLADRMRAEKDGAMKGAQKVSDKPKSLMGATGKVVVGMTEQQQGKSKSALRREKAKQKKKEEDDRKALEEKMLAEQQQAAQADNAADPVKRAKKVKKILKQIDELKQKDPSTLNDDQKKKVETEASLREELAKLEM